MDSRKPKVYGVIGAEQNFVDDDFRYVIDSQSAIFATLVILSEQNSTQPFQKMNDSSIRLVYSAFDIQVPVDDIFSF